MKSLSALFFFFFVSHGLFASDGRLLACLGQEELKIHREKDTGPLYFLNRRFVNYFTQFSSARISRASFNKICKNEKISPSIALLQSILLSGSNFFSRGTNLRIKNELVIHSWKIFFDYMLKLQGQMKDPHCFTKHIPEYDQLLKRYKYLESDHLEKVLPLDKKKRETQIKSIFDKLKRVDLLSRKCNRDFPGHY